MGLFHGPMRWRSTTLRCGNLDDDVPDCACYIYLIKKRSHLTSLKYRILTLKVSWSSIAHVINFENISVFFFKKADDNFLSTVNKSCIMWKIVWDNYHFTMFFTDSYVHCEDSSLLSCIICSLHFSSYNEKQFWAKSSCITAKAVILDASLINVM
jgi:hypothetical protein